MIATNKKQQMTLAREHPITLRISVTCRCQLQCLYCRPAGDVSTRSRAEILSFEEILRFVRLLKSHLGLAKVHITGGDPLVRRGIVDLVAMLAAEGITDLALTTNGQALAQMARDLKRAGLRRINISLDSLNNRTFASLTHGGKLKDTLAGIRAALQEGFAPIKLNTVVLRTVNDSEVVTMAQWALDHFCHIRFLELMPVGCAKRIFKNMFVPASEVRRRLEDSLALRALVHAPEQTSRDFAAYDSHGRRGVVGFITAQSAPFCSGCRRLRLTSTGQLISCLARGCGSDVRSLLRSNSQCADQALLKIVESEFEKKRVRAAFDTPHPMGSVGG